MSARRRHQAHRARHQGYGTGVMLTLLLFLLAVGGMSWVYRGMVSHERWPIRWLEVDGEFERVGAEQVRAAVSPLVDESYFTVDLNEVSAAARRLPWVADAMAIKHWPDTVRVEIREHEAVAHWDDGHSDNLMVSRDARLFEVAGAASMQGLPWLAGPTDRHEDVFRQWHAFNDQLEPVGLRVERLELDARGAWTVGLSNGTRVALGRRDASRRLARTVRAWGALVAAEGMAPLRVDARYANGLAVRWPVIEETEAGEALALLDR
ncbi:MAG: cell division protein FtsQ/DivIB [Xanthomonadales bacterium]|nr:cell division protein FtsQ/DivIB [Xanthomonadales bacterium]